MDNALLVAHVTEVRGVRIKARVREGRNEQHLFYHGYLVRNVSVGGYVKIPCGFESVIGKIDGEYQVERFNLSGNANARTKAPVEYDRMVNISVFGVLGRNGFERGLSVLPLIASPVYVLTDEELSAINTPSEANDESIVLGKLAGNEAVNVFAPVNKLFASHIGIFGNTGSGKSNTLCKLYTDCFMRFPHMLNNATSRFVFIDFNGEYAHDGTLHKNKAVFTLTTKDDKGDRYPVPPEFYFDTHIWAMLTSATEKTQKPFLSHVIKTAERITEASNKQRYTMAIVKGVLGGYANKPLLFSEQRNDLIGALAFLVDHNDLSSSQDTLDEMLSGFETRNQEGKIVLWRVGHGFCDTPEKALAEFENVCDSLVDFDWFKQDAPTFMLFVARLVFLEKWQNGSIVREHIAWWLPRYERQLEESRRIYKINDALPQGTIQVISLLHVNQEQKKTIPLVIAKYAYEWQKQRKEGFGSTHLIIDEAHNILSYSSQRESESWRDYRLETFEEIVKEGRKFGMYITVCSQRPSDISATIISQMHNYFIHRLVNDEDLHAIEKAVSFIDRESFSMIPALPQGGCIVSGVAVPYPTRIQVDAMPLDKRPASGDRDLFSLWDDEIVWW